MSTLEEMQQRIDHLEGRAAEEIIGNWSNGYMVWGDGLDFTWDELPGSPPRRRMTVTIQTGSPRHAPVLTPEKLQELADRIALDLWIVVRLAVLQAPRMLCSSDPESDEAWDRTKARTTSTLAELFPGSDQ